MRERERFGREGNFSHADESDFTAVCHKRERERERERERARERAFTNVAHSAFVTTVTLLIASAYFLECSACVYLI